MSIGIAGSSFTVNGSRVTVAGFNDQSFLYRFCRREDLTPVLQSRKEVMAETVNAGAPFLPVIAAFGMMWNIPRNMGLPEFDPSKFPNFYTDVIALSDELWTNWGFAFALTVFADRGLFGWSDQQCVDHWGRLAQMAQGRKHLMLAIVNENDQHQNGVPIEKFQKPNGIYSCKGSNGGDRDPILPAWDFAYWHCRRDRFPRQEIEPSSNMYAQWGYEREDGKPRFEGAQSRLISDEKFGFCEPGQERGASRVSDTRYAYTQGFMDARTAGGYFFSDDTQQSRPFRPVQRVAALTYFMGMSKFDVNQRF